MAQQRLSAAQAVQVAERVTFRDGRRTVAGYVARKGRTSAHIVTDDGRECRVPYPLLSRTLGTPRQHVQSRTETLRAQFQAGDRVGFAVGTDVLHGTISRLNPTYAHVVCDDDREYRVPYARLTLQACGAQTALCGHQRTDGDLQAIAARATAWIAAHQRAGWSFQFDHATKRAGCCHYQTRVISLAYAYAKAAADEAIDDTLRHEIAHARVGKATGMIRSGRRRQSPWAVQANAVTISSSRPRATSSGATRGAGSRPPSGGSVARCVARVSARCGIRPTRKRAGRTPRTSRAPRHCPCTTVRHERPLPHPARPGSYA